MTPIKITDTNATKIQDALEAVNGKAAAWTIMLFRDVERVAEKVEKKLASLPKADRVGAVATFRPAGPTAKSYKYAARSTTITMERRATGWFLTDVIASDVYPKMAEALDVAITQEQADEIQRRAIAEFHVKTRVPA